MPAPRRELVPYVHAWPVTPVGGFADRVQQVIYVRGPGVCTTTSGDIGAVDGEAVESGAPAQTFHDDMELPVGINEADRAFCAEVAFNAEEIRVAHLIAIEHAKVRVIDPSYDDCAVITGSRNFSVSASERNDENLVIVRGNTKLAQADAGHMNGVYDHYSWRAYLASGGDPAQIQNSIAGSHAVRAPRNSTFG